MGVGTITIVMQGISVRKGMSLNMIGGVVLAIVGVGVLLMMFSGTFGDGFQSTFCSVYGSMSALFPGDAPSPAACGPQDDVSYDAMECPDPDSCVLDMVSAVSGCWQDYQGFMTEEELCQGWNVVSLDEAITEAQVTERMIDNDICPDLIENTEEGCGAENQIRFDGPVEEGDFVIMEYQSDGSDEWIAVE